MIIADMHVHSIFSPDGVSTMEEHCEEAINQGISKICFTDHVDFNSAELNLNKIKDLRKFRFNTDEYFNEINRLRLKYTSLEILSGIEFSEPHLFQRQFAYYQDLPFDYILGSIHHCYNSVFPGIGNLNEQRAIFEYYDLMTNTITQCKFQAIAHIDFPRRYFDYWRVAKSTIDQILKLIIEKQIVLEVNTSSISDICIEPMPEFLVINRYVELGGTRVVLGSDAHCCKNLAKGFDDIIKRIPNNLEIGYFSQRKFIEIKR